jgi:uroporphyrinogen decarboxylase
MSKNRQFPSNKDCLDLILQGKIPDKPPHFELVFQIAKEMFGMDIEAVAAKYSTQAEQEEALFRYHIDLQLRLVEEFDYAAVYPSYGLRGITELKKAVGNRSLVAPHDGGGVFWMPAGKDMINFAVMLYEQPHELHEEARRKCDAAKERLSQMNDAGADFFVLAHDFGFNEGPFISPKHFSEFVTPYLAEIVEFIHNMGKIAILHSDGNINEILDQIYSTGIDGYHSVDPQGHMDIKAVREQYPDWILMGNVKSSMLQSTDEAQIRESVQYCMKYGGVGKRYILSTSNCVFAGMPPKSYLVMLDEYHRILGE